jgi:hypothetical protein
MRHPLLSCILIVTAAVAYGSDASARNNPKPEPTENDIKQFVSAARTDPTCTVFRMQGTKSRTYIVATSDGITKTSQAFLTLVGWDAKDGLALLGTMELDAASLGHAGFSRVTGMNSVSFGSGTPPIVVVNGTLWNSDARAVALIQLDGSGTKLVPTRTAGPGKDDGGLAMFVVSQASADTGSMTPAALLSNWTASVEFRDLNGDGVPEVVESSTRYERTGRSKVATANFSTRVYSWRRGKLHYDNTLTQKLAAGH